MPLLLEVPPVVDSPGRFVDGAAVKAAAPGVALAHIGHVAVALAEILGDGDVHLFRFLRIVHIAVGLGIGRLPVPGLLRVDHGEGPVGSAKGEELLQLGAGLGRVANDQRLALPVEPEILVQVLLVEVVIDLRGRLTGLGVHHE